jgi:hypothetical protein
MNERIKPEIYVVTGSPPMLTPSLRAKRSNPDAQQKGWIASSQVLLE